MIDKLLIVFVKNAIPGKTKTRLANRIGNENALFVYGKLLAVTEKVIGGLDADIQVHYSQEIENENWQNATKFVQSGDDLGERMAYAFKQGFENGYKRIVLIGSDCPDLSQEIITEAYNQLSTHSAVFGPALDGGYYLIGLSKNIDQVFENKSWSQEELLDDTVSELDALQIRYHLLKQSLNDIDNFDDLKQSSLLTQDKTIIDIINQY